MDVLLSESKKQKDAIDLTTWVEYFRYATVILLALDSTERYCIISYDLMTDIAYVEPLIYLSMS